MQENTGPDPLAGLPSIHYRHPSSRGAASPLEHPVLLPSAVPPRPAPAPLSLHRTGSWSVHPTVSSPGPHPWDADALTSPPGLLPNGAPGRRRPRRTLTDNATEFLHAVDDLLGSQVSRHGPSHMPLPPPPVNLASHGMEGPLSPKSAAFPMPMEHAFGVESAGPAPLPLGSTKFGFPMPSHAIGSPPIRTQDERAPASDWPLSDVEGQPMWPSMYPPTQTPAPIDPLGYGPSTAVLSSSPDDATAPLHAEKSVALVLGDDEPRSHMPPAPPTGHARPDVLDASMQPSAFVNHDLAQRVRSMTLPVDLSVGPMRERTGSVHRAHRAPDSPSSPMSGGRISTHARKSAAAAVAGHGVHGMYARYTPQSPSMASSATICDSPDALDPSSRPGPKRREEGKWFGRPGTLRLGDTVPIAPTGPAVLDDELAPYVRARSQATVHDVHGDEGSVRSRNSSRTRAYERGTGDLGGRFHRRDEGGVPRAVSAPLQDDAAHWELRDVRGQLAEISMDQHGSRLIQEKLDHCTPQERTQVFEELFPESRRLMADVFGNYVIQKLLEYGTREQVRTLGGQLEGHVLSLSLGTYGCRVVQKAFERVDEEQKIRLGQELHPHVLDCVRDQNANHVIQKILEQVPSPHLDFIASAFLGHVPVLASHCYSCRVLQRIFAYCSEEQRRPLLDEMHKDTLRLMQDQYGNYVVQWVLQHGEERDRLAIVGVAKSHLLALSRHKFASNVVEHVIQVAQPADLADLLEELLAPLRASDVEGLPLLLEGTAPLCIATVMMQDQYANYVLQRFLQTLHGHDRERLVQTIRPVLYALRQRQALMAAQSNAASTPYTGSIRIPGGGHIGNKPLLAIERLIEQGP